MKTLLYTGVPKSDSIQTDVTRSLGGYISSTYFYNNVDDNLFNSLTINNIKNKEHEYRLLCFKMEETTANVGIWINSNSPLIQFKLAFVSPQTDSCGNYYFESIPFGTVQPSQAQFLEIAPNTLLSSFTSATNLGIWIKREVKDNAYASIRDIYTCENFDDNLEIEKQVIKFDLNIKFD